MADTEVIVPADAVASTIESFTALDASGDKRTMNKLARRLGKDQPALLQFAAATKEEHGEVVGEAAVFYGTLVWAMFERHFGKKLPRLTVDNLDSSAKVVSEERGKIEGLDEKPIAERTAPELVERQPHVYAKLTELIAEDVKEEAMTEETAVAIFEPTQAVVEAFDAAVEGRRPGERLGPVVRDQPKVGRNDPCPCGSGKKHKRCCG
jgi:hypothetical protein